MIVPYHLRIIILLGLMIGSAPEVSWGKPRILTHPINQSLALGVPLNLSVEATGSGPLRYQWRKNGVRIPGATGPTFSVLAVQAMDGGKYRVTVTDSSGDDDDASVNSRSATVSINLPDLLPFSDNFTLLSDNLINGLAGIVYTASGNNIGAAKQAGELNHASKKGGASVWLKWKPAVDGIATFNTKGSAFDTLLAVYTGDSLSALDPVAGNDDRSEYLTSAVTFTALRSTEYHIVVDGLAGGSGEIILSWMLVATADRVPHVKKHPLSKTGMPGEQLTVNVEYDNSGTVQWLRHDASVANGTSKELSIDNLSGLKVGTYACRISTLTREIFSEPAQVQIHIRGDGTIVRDVLADDKFGDAFGSSLRSTVALQAQGRPRRSSFAPASGYRGTQVFSTSGATSDDGEPNHCGVMASSSEWYAYQTPASGILTIDTDGSDFDTVLAVYTSSTAEATFESLQLVVCDKNSGADGLDSKVTFQAVAGTMYYIAVDTESGITGTATLNYNLIVMSDIPSQATDEDVPAGPLTFTLGDLDSQADACAISATCSDTNLLPAGSLVFGGSGASRTVTVTPAPNRYGKATITIYASNGSAITSDGFDLTINPVNDPPLARNITAMRSADQAVKISIEKLLLSARDPEGDAILFSGVTASSLNGASISSSSRWIFYTPPAGFNDTDEFSYTIADVNGATASGTISVQIFPPSTSLAPNSVSITRLENGQMLVRFAGIPGRTYTIQTSSDLVSWSNLGTSLAASNGIYEYLDAEAASFPTRYYRSVWP